MTGGRIKRLQKFFKKDEKFMFTYGDGVSNVNLTKLKKISLKTKKNSYSDCCASTSKIWGNNYKKKFGDII